MTTLRHVRKVLTAFIALIGVFSSSYSHAETTQCTEIIALPTIITVQGVYCFKMPLTTNITTGNAIDIQTNNVTIDFNHFKLGGLAAGLGTETFGVYAAERKNITLRNGSIRGFSRGVFFDNTDGDLTNQGGHSIENNRFDGNTVYGMRLEGINNVIKNNQVQNTGGSTVHDFAYGIKSSGANAEITNNEIDNTFSQGIESAYGIHIGNADANVVKDNTIMKTDHSGTGNSFGIYRNNGLRVAIIGNAILNEIQDGTKAIRGGTSVEALCVANRMMKYTTGLGACHDGGRNIHHP